MPTIIAKPLFFRILINSLIIALLFVTSTASNAKKLYKYQDKTGRWHYTDKKPAELKTKELKVEVRQISVEPKQRVWLKNIGKKREPEYIIRNDYFAPIEVEVSLSEHENTQVSPSLPRRFVIQHGESDSLFTLNYIDQRKGWRYGIGYKYALGSPLAKHNDKAVYYPPIASYKKFRITQAFNGKFSHTDAQNKYAVDLAMPLRSRVHAARGGIVMSVENDFFKGGVDKQAYKARANSVRILHNDGSMAVYAHLQVDRAQVYEGMKVEAGQLIAYSGNTGFSSGPHLHFSVQVNKGMRLVSVPFKFTNAQGRTFKPIAGQWLEGFELKSL